MRYYSYFVNGGVVHQSEYTPAENPVELFYEETTPDVFIERSPGTVRPKPRQRVQPVAPYSYGSPIVWLGSQFLLNQASKYLHERQVMTAY